MTKNLRQLEGRIIEANTADITSVLAPPCPAEGDTRCDEYSYLYPLRVNPHSLFKSLYLLWTVLFLTGCSANPVTLDPSPSQPLQVLERASVPLAQQQRADADSFVVSVVSASAIKLIKYKDGKEIKTIRASKELLEKVNLTLSGDKNGGPSYVFGPRDGLLAISSIQSVVLLQILNGELSWYTKLETDREYEHDPRSISLSPDRRYLYTLRIEEAGADSGLFRVDTKTGEGVKVGGNQRWGLQKPICLQHGVLTVTLKEFDELSNQLQNEILEAAKASGYTEATFREYVRVYPKFVIGQVFSHDGSLLHSFLVEAPLVANFANTEFIARQPRFDGTASPQFRRVVVKDSSAESYKMPLVNEDLAAWQENGPFIEYSSGFRGGKLTWYPRFPKRVNGRELLKTQGIDDVSIGSASF